MIRVAVVDDQALMRAGFRALLDAEDGIEVVGEAADGEQGLALVRAQLPDIALIDVQMPVMTGIEATRRIAADPDLSGVRVVILTNYGLDEYVFEALRAGASGFLLKDTDPADLLQAIEIVAGGEALLSPSVTRTLIGEFVSRPPDRALPRTAANAHPLAAPAWNTSPAANARSPRWPRAASPTRRSPPTWSSARSRRRPTSAGR
jgi:DNA-binding NarL/FixJ family response regulator